MGRVDELERRMSELESGVGESGYPTFIHVGPDGSVTYEFEGAVTATGLIVLAKRTEGEEPEKEIVFQDPDYPTTEEAIARLYAIETAPPNDDIHFIKIQATDNSDPSDVDGGSSLSMRADGSGVGPSQGAWVAANAGLESRRIIDGGQQSDFLQLPDAIGPDDVRVSFGNNTVPFTAQNSATLVINHNLGKTPLAVIATVADTGSSRYCQTDTYTPTQFTVRVKIEGAGTSSVDSPVAWIAIG